MLQELVLREVGHFDKLLVDQSMRLTLTELLDEGAGLEELELLGAHLLVISSKIGMTSVRSSALSAAEVGLTVSLYSSLKVKINLIISKLLKAKERFLRNLWRLFS